MIVTFGVPSRIMDYVTALETIASVSCNLIVLKMLTVDDLSSARFSYTTALFC